MLSRSQYARELQCLKSLWLYKFRRELENQEENSRGFSIGNQVGELARSYFPGGIEIEFNPDNFNQMAEKTKVLINQKIEVIYEATFIEKGVLAMADILVKRGDSYEIYEVKSSTGVKDYHTEDISVSGMP